MAITIDHGDIIDALAKFRLEINDYYLEFTDNCIYMYWVASPKDVTEYLTSGLDVSCLALQVKGTWKYADYLPENHNFHTFINCRYILATD